MSKHNVMLDSLLYVFGNLETDVSGKLNDIITERERREYRNDILQLTAIDVTLLTSYFLNSNEEAQNQFLGLLKATYNDDVAVENFMAEFKNLYYLNKSDLTTVTQYGAAKRVVLDFINRLKDEALSEKALDKIKEKEFADKLFIVRKLIKYFTAKAGSVEVKNIDDFILMLNVLGVSDKVKNNALCIAIENNAKYYTKVIRSKKNSLEEEFE